MSAYFRFESDFVNSLRCIPMAVRMQLDLAGVKLKLSEWSKLTLSDRQALVETPCATEDEIREYQKNISLLVATVCGTPPALIPMALEKNWENEREIPHQVVEKAALHGVRLLPEAWKSLRPLQRFALEKLSRPGHEGNNFRPALIEFGFHPTAPESGARIG